MDPSSAVGWSEISTYYDEFRVVAAKLKIYCTAPNSITRISDLCCVVFDNDDSGALTSTGQAYAYSDKMLFPSVFVNPQEGYEFSAVRPASNGSPVPWIDAQSPFSSLGAFKFFSETLDVTTTIVRVYFEYFLEARGRR